MRIDLPMNYSLAQSLPAWTSTTYAEISLVLIQTILNRSRVLRIFIGDTRQEKVADSMLEYALAYAARGWKVFPLPPGSKKPYPRTHGVLEATGAADQIEEWWRRWPDANIGIATGADSGLVVLDVDPRHGGDESLIELQRRIGALPNTPESITGSGGRHLFFRCDRENEPHNSAGLMKLPGLDIRGWHGYVLAPPSRNENGPYVWDIGTEDLPYAPFPEALVVKEEDRKASPIPDVIPAGMRNDTLMSIAGSMRRRGLTAEEIFAGLVKVAQRCIPIPPDEDVRKIAVNAAHYSPAADPKNLPTDEAGERDLIGACIIGSNEVVSRVIGLGVGSADFSNVLASKAFTAIESLHLGGHPIDISTIRSEADRIAGRSDGYLLQFLDDCMTQVPGSVNSEAYATSVLERSARRQILRVSGRLRSLAYAPADSRTELVGKVGSEFDTLLRHQTPTTGMNAFELALRHAHILAMREARDPSVVGLAPGYPTLDAVTAYLPGELWYVAARPSVGKTMVLKELQWHLAKRSVPSLFVSVEQPSMQLVDRNIASMSRVNSRLIQSGKMNEQEWDAVNRAVEEFSNFGDILHIVDDESMTTARLDSIVRAYVTRHNVRVVFVDYVQILTDEYGNSQNDRVSYISRRLREIARATQTTFVVACQLSRDGAAGEPQLHHLRDSGGLEQDAFVVLGLWRESSDSGEVKVKVMKNRNGENGVGFSLAYDAATLRLREAVTAFGPSITPVITEPPKAEPAPVQTSLDTPLN